VLVVGGMDVMSAALAEYRQRYKAARARLWGGEYVERPVVRDILHLSARPAIIYDEPVGPRRPLFADSIVLPTSRAKAREILQEVADRTGFTIEELVSMRRTQPLCDARNEIYYRLKKETTWSYPRIGEFLGDRDHTTVMSGARKHAKRLEAGQ
jgi:hypothetical protein